MTQSSASKLGSKSGTGKREPGSEALGRYDVAREARRLEGVATKVAKLKAKGRGAEAEEALKRGERRARASLAMEVANAEKLGAHVPEVRALLKASWQVVRVDVPVGDLYAEALPAYVVQFDGNAPIERLKRTGALGEGQVRAAAKFTGLWLQAVKAPKVTGSYDGIVASGGQAPRPWVDVMSGAWKRLREAMDTMLPVECEIVQEVAVYETPIEALAKRGLVAPKKLAKAEGAVLQSLSCGLLRLSYHWGLEAGGPQDVPK